MKLGLFCWMVALLSNVACSVRAVPAEATSPAPNLPAADGPIAIYSSTTHVQALAAAGDVLWVATRGGLERYAVDRALRTQIYTTRDGLPSLFLQDVSIGSNGLPHVTTAHHDCVLHGPSGRFACGRRESNAKPTGLAAGERLEGAAITARWRDPSGREWLGTAGRGLWLRSTGRLLRLTPTDQLTGNHVVAISEWRDSAWFATFDRGLTRCKGGQFSEAPLAPQMLNDVVGTSVGLFVATSEGLYFSRDGESFERDRRVTERSVSDLAYDPNQQVLYATATNSLWEISLGQPNARARATYQPGGSRSLQAVDVSPDGTVFLASEDRGALRRDGKKRFVGFDRLSGYPSSWATDVLALGGKSALVGSLKHGLFPLGSAPSVSVPVDPWILFLGRDTRDPATIFVGTQAGALVVDTTGSRRIDALPNPCVHSMARLTSGLWVGTEGGLALYR